MPNLKSDGGAFTASLVGLMSSTQLDKQRQEDDIIKESTCFCFYTISVEEGNAKGACEGIVLNAIP